MEKYGSTVSGAKKHDARVEEFFFYIKRDIISASASIRLYAHTRVRVCVFEKRVLD